MSLPPVAFANLERQISFMACAEAALTIGLITTARHIHLITFKPPLKHW